MSFFDELKRRNVIQVALAYLVASWLVLQITDVLMSVLGLSENAGKFVFLLLVIGFIPVLVFAWAYEVTPDGIKRDSEVDRDASVTREIAARLNRTTIVLLIAVAVMVVVDRFVPEGEMGSEPFSQQASENIDAQQEEKGGLTPTPPADDGKVSVAVLPFINLSDDAQNEYFSDGISEELLNVLVRIDELRVPSRTSSFTFKGSDENVVEIGKKLRVGHVLEGSVRKAGNRIRVTAQLIDVNTDTHLWSDTYTRELDDIFAVQDEIAQAIVKALKLTLSVGEQQKLADHSTDNVEAYNHYLQGQYLWNQRSVTSLKLALNSFNKAIELDPDFGQAWVALADTYLVLPEYEFGSAERYIPESRKALKKALAINPDSARALAVSGITRAQYDFDWTGAISDFERAIELDPSHATARQWYGDVLMPLGRTEEALEQLRLAAIADPLSIAIRHTPGYFNLWTGRLDEAESIYFKVLEINPNFRWTMQNLDMLYTMRGEYDKARHWASKLADLEGFDPAPDLARIDAVENPALKPRALELLQQRTDIVEGVWGKAMQYALMNEYDLALVSLEKAFETESPWRVHMKWVVNYEPLHDNPRFQEMLKKMNLLP